MSEEEILLRIRQYLTFACPHCQKKVKVEFKWVPEVVEITTQEVTEK